MERKESQSTETSFHGYPKIFPLGDIKLKLVWNLGPQQDSKDACVCMPEYAHSRELARVSCVLFFLGGGAIGTDKSPKCYLEGIIPLEKSYKSGARSLLTYFLNILW